MRILIISTSERTGGAALAAGRLTEALNSHGIQATMLVRDKDTDNPAVVTAGCRRFMLRHFLWERLCLFFHLHFSRRHLFHIDMANAGTDITRLKVFKEADVIHLHWINQGMLSLKGICKIIRSGKPVVWTLHDIWPATALCHLTLGCERFKEQCHHCPYLPGGGSAHDLSHRVWQQKSALLSGARVAFVGCSEWLAGEARKSGLLKAQTVRAIPNPIDTAVFCPHDKAAARRRLNLPADRRIVLFVAQRIGNAYKGIDYLSQALSRLCADHPDVAGRLSLVLLGSAPAASILAGDVSSRIEQRALGYISDPTVLADVYSAADVFVLPSLSENLPNTIMESMACGTPCVGFRVGGIPEMIDHGRNGYVADYRDADDLAHGLYWTLFEADAKLLSEEAVGKVARCYSQTAVADSYKALYQQLMTQGSDVNVGK